MSASERLHEVMGGIVRFNPVVNLTTVTERGCPHSTTVWFAPSEDLTEIFWFSSLNDNFRRVIYKAGGNKPIRVSGSMQTPQSHDVPLTSLSFEGRINYKVDKARAIGAFVASKAFTEDEITTLVSPPWYGEESSSDAYSAVVSVWNIIEERQKFENRVTTVAWPQL